MPEYSHPGVFIQETSIRTREIEGVPTETAAFVGYATDGPANEPAEITSLLDFKTRFGKVSASIPLSSAVQAFFDNGGRKAFVVRAEAGPRSRRGSAELIGDEKARTGLHALDGLPMRPALLVLPDAAYMSDTDAADAINRAASYAQARRMFLIADVPEAVASAGHSEAARWATDNLTRNRNLAIYFPWLVAASGSRTKTKRLMPPAGIVAGIYARLDNARGVWKAPAGGEATPTGIADLAQKVSAADQQRLIDASINPIVNMTGKGIMLWAARTFAAAGDVEWKYVNVRRMLLFLESSIERGLAWAVFEPNDETLWAQIRLEVSSFLYRAWIAGALMGTTSDEAYFVRCDATTMTQDDIDNGRLVALIGAAPVRPAEFVIIRIDLLAKVA